LEAQGETEREAVFETDLDDDGEMEREAVFETDLDDDVEMEREAVFETDLDDDGEMEREAVFEIDLDDDGDIDAVVEADFEIEGLADFVTDGVRDIEADTDRDFEGEVDPDREICAELDGDKGKWAPTTPLLITSRMPKTVAGKFSKFASFMKFKKRQFPWNSKNLRIPELTFIRGPPGTVQSLSEPVYKYSIDAQLVLPKWLDMLSTAVQFPILPGLPIL
jgi:hypothetical protein